MDCVINRHDVITLPFVPTKIDIIHRRIRGKGTFDKNDLDEIVSHYATTNPIRSNSVAGVTLKELYERLELLGEYSNLIPESLEALEDRYIPGVSTRRIYASVTNHGVPDDHHIELFRFNNEDDRTGYEIKFGIPDRGRGSSRRLTFLDDTRQP